VGRILSNEKENKGIFNSFPESFLRERHPGSVSCREIILGGRLVLNEGKAFVSTSRDFKVLIPMDN
jgi:hypothetical protein